MIILYLKKNNIKIENIVKELNSKYPSCPKCKTNKFFKVHDSYSRNVCVFRNEKVERLEILIQRLLCTSCGTTHALLPDDIIPYAYYSKSFIMYCLIEYYINGVSVSDIVEKTNTYPMLIYKLLKKFKSELTSLIIFLKTYLDKDLKIKEPPKKMINLIINIKSFSNFLKNYFFNTYNIFLMNKRRNIVSKKTLIGYMIC